MKISVITPTADQPKGMALAEKYMARQTVQPHEWIVADDGIEPAALTMGQTHLVRPREHEGGKSLAQNVLAALDRVTGDVVVVWEHDDWYHPEHLEVCRIRLETAGATGSVNQRYYNVEHRAYIVMRNVGSALCNTAFHADHIKLMRRAAQKAFDKGSIGVDRNFWDMLPAPEKDIHRIDTVVGIKGLPGRKGLGMGHRPDNRWRKDPQGHVLIDWIGRDAENYV
jgi:glycosyltransferase involved in cell wall biosynthesis